MKTFARAFVCVAVATSLGLGFGCSGGDASGQGPAASVGATVPADQTVTATLPASPAAMQLGVSAWVTTARITHEDGLHTLDVTTIGQSARGETVAQMQGHLQQLEGQAPTPYVLHWTSGASSTALSNIEQGNWTVALRESYQAVLDDRARLTGNTGLHIDSPSYPNCCQDEANVAKHLLAALLAATGAALLACATPIIDTVACAPAIIAEITAGVAYQDAMNILWTCVGEKAKACGGTPIGKADASVATPVVAD